MLWAPAFIAHAPVLDTQTVPSIPFFSLTYPGQQSYSFISFIRNGPDNVRKERIKELRLACYNLLIH